MKKAWPKQDQENVIDGWVWARYLECCRAANKESVTHDDVIISFE